MPLAPVEPTKGVLRIPRRDPSWRLVGQTPNGQDLFEREIVEVVLDARGNPVREPVLGPDNEPIWDKHPTTGVPIKQRMRNKKQRRTQRFFVHIECNSMGVATGTHTIVEYNDEMEQDMIRAKRQMDSTTFRDEFFARAQARGLSPEELLDKIGAPQTYTPEAQPTSQHKPDPDAKYPRWSGPRTGWQLSNQAYVEREDGESKESYKARAEQAEAALNTT